MALVDICVEGEEVEVDGDPSRAHNVFSNEDEVSDEADTVVFEDPVEGTTVVDDDEGTDNVGALEAPET